MIRLSIRRPVAVAMAYLAVALLGVVAWRNIPLELLPDTSFPRLRVTGTWRGASPETIEAFLTSPMEAEIQRVRGVEKITSTSYEQQGTGRAEIDVEFARDTDMDFARLELAERMATLEEDLPPGTGRITVTPYVPRELQDRDKAFLVYTFTGPYTLEALRAHLDDVVVPELARIDGVATVVPSGGRERRIEVELAAEAIGALGLTPATVRQAIDDLDLVREAGAVREGRRQWTVTIRNRATAVEDLRSAVVAVQDGTSVLVSDVATVWDTYEEPTRHYRIDGRAAVSFTVYEEVSANTVRVADRVKARVDELEARNPYGASFILDVDQSEEIRAQLTDLRTRALAAAVVIFVVLLGFLRSFRSAGVIFATIAFSVLIALNLVYFAGMSLNLLTLMGLALGFGLVVDNSIVVLENVYRRWQGGEEPAEAAEKGSRQVVLPILASTATTLIVFLPFVYLQGELRLYYVPLAVVVGFTLVASLFVAFTFIPALAARILGMRGRERGPAPVPAGRAVFAGGGPDEGGVVGGDGAVRDGPAVGGAAGRPPVYVRFYRELVGFTLRHPWLAIVVAALCFGGSYYLFDKYVTRGVIWGGGGAQQTYVSVRITLPRGSDLERTDELARFFEEKLAAMPEVDRFETNVTGTYGNIHVTFPDSLELTSVPVAIKEQMVAYSLGFTGADVRVYGVGPSFGYGGGGSAPNYSIGIYGYNYERVREIAENLGQRLTRISRIEEVDTNASGGWYNRDRAVEYVVEIDRDALARYDMTVQEFVGRLQSAVAGAVRRGSLKVGGEEVEYDVKLEDAREIDVLALRETILTGPGGTGIRLGDVVTIEPREVLARIEREDQQYQRRVAYEFLGPRKLGDVVRDAVVDATELPPGYRIETDDGWRWSAEEQGQIYMVLAVAILLVFMVTAALFESVRQPLCVLLTVPMALIGVFLIFFFRDATFTREAYIGVIMMGGVVVNNAILLVDHVNQVRRERAGGGEGGGRGTGVEEGAAGAADVRRAGGGGSGRDDRDAARNELREAILRGTLERVRPILMTTTTTVMGLLPLVLFSETVDANIWNALAYTLIGGLLASTLFVLTTTPALYLLFERGRVGRVAAARPSLRSAGATVLVVAALGLVGGCGGDAGASGSAGGGGVDDVPVREGSVTLEIGDLEGPRERTFGRIGGVAMDGAGRIYVADLQADEIRAFGADGDFLFTVARRGGGPGEVSGPCCLAFGPGGELWTREWGNARYSAFRVGESGAGFVGSVAVNHRWPHRQAPITFVADTLVDVGWVSDPENEELVEHRFHVAPGGDVARTVAIPSPTFEELGGARVELERTESSSTHFMFWPAFGPGHLIAHGPGGLWAEAMSDVYRVTVHRPGGGSSVIENRQHRGPLVTAEERERQTERIRQARERLGAGSYRIDGQVPERKPPLSALYFDAEGRLWVELTSASREIRQADLYRPGGSFLERRTWPRGVRINLPGSIGGDTALGVTRDSLGVERVVRVGWPGR